MKFVIDLIFDIFFEKFLKNVDKEKSPGLHTFMQVMNMIGMFLGLMALGYFLFILYLFKDYKGG